MEFMDIIFYALLFTIPALVVFMSVFVILKSFFKNEEKKWQFEMRHNAHKASLPIRLQAYERLVLLMERLTPNNLIYRVKKRSMSASELQSALLMEIRNEFDHNISQQLYVSPSTWQVIVNSKEEIIKLINVSYSGLSDKSTAMDLSKAIFDRVLEMDSTPTQQAILYLKKEAHEII